ncbi:hypothetical protein D3C77_499930 [compost metagenome]
MRIYKRSIAINFFAIHHFYSRNFDNFILCNRQTRCLNVKYDICSTLQIIWTWIQYNCNVIINNVGLQPINHFDTMLACCFIRIWITLNAAMIRHGYRFMSPFSGRLNILSDRRNSIHRAHRRM